MDLAEIVAKKKELFKQIERGGRDLLRGEFKKFFEAHPEVQAVRWRQYTPYFNDGDACVFGRHEFETRANAEAEFMDSWSHRYEGVEGKATWDWSKQKAACEELSRSLGACELNDVFLAAFGDHVEVVATREAFEVSECSHD